MPSASDRRPSTAPWLQIALGLLVIIAIFTRVPAPWRIEAINDEYHHLESWRNRYRTDDIFPLFKMRIEQMFLAGSRVRRLAQTVYESGPLAQRACIVLVDPQPPLFPVMAECIEAVTHSNLVALRLPSMLASLLSLFFAYRIGCRLRGPALGVWLAALFAIGPLYAIYAGVGRPYAITQCALMAVILEMIRDRGERPGTPRRFLLVALLAQSTQWMAWALIGPMVVSVLLDHWRRGASPLRLLRQTWWYALLSAGLLVEMAVQLKNPTLTNQSFMPPLAQMWEYWSIASPWSHLGAFGDAGLWISGAALLVLCLAGAAVLIGDRTWLRVPVRGTLLAALAISIAAPVLLGAETRFMMTYVVFPVLLGAVGACALARLPRAAMVTACAMLLVFGFLSLFCAEEPYVRVFPRDVRWSEVAERLRAQIEPGAEWGAYPYYRTNGLYRYGPLPEPAMLESAEAMRHWVEHPHAAPRYLLTTLFETEQVPVLRDAPQSWTFNDHFVLVRLAPIASP